MPSFCDCGSDKYMCQGCGRDLCSKDYPSEWLPIIRNGKELKVSGNHCFDCALKRIKNNTTCKSTNND